MTTMTDQKKRFGSAGRGSGGTGGARGSDPDGAGGPAADTPGTRSGKRTLVVIIVAVLLLAGAGGGYFFFLRGPSQPEPPTGGAMVQMDPMTLSLAKGHYLKVQVAVQLVEGKANADTFGTIKISQMIIDTFSNRTVGELTQDGNRKKLMSALLTDVQKEYPDEVFDLYLTQFVLQ